MVSFTKQINKVKEGLSMDWYIRKFEELKLEEMYEILKIRSEVFVVEQNCVYQDCDNKDKVAYHLFATENGSVVAYLRILEQGIYYDEPSVGRVLTSKEQRGRGLGKIAMIKAIDFIKNTLKEEKIKISAQEYAIPFYEGVGFKVFSKVYLEDDIPHVEMIASI